MSRAATYVLSVNGPERPAQSLEPTPAWPVGIATMLAITIKAPCSSRYSWAALTDYVKR